MSITYMDDFKHYGSDVSNLLDGTPWIDTGGTTTALVTDPDANASGYVLRPRSGNGSVNYNDTCRLALATPDTKVGIAFRIWPTALPDFPADSESIHVRDGSNTMIYHWSIRPNGEIILYRGTTHNARVQVAASGSPVILAGTWTHLELWIDTVTGEYWAWKEGIPITALTGTDGSPPSTTIGIIGFADGEPGSGGTQDPYYIKSLITADNAGTVNNTPGDIGPVNLYTLVPNSDVSGAWTPSTGSALFSTVDELAINDADYISADDTLPAAAVMGLENLPADIVAIRGVQTNVRMRKSDGGDATVQVSMVSNGVDDSGADRAISTGFTYYHDISELDPNTAAAWTPTAFNLANLKINRTL